MKLAMISTLASWLVFAAPTYGADSLAGEHMVEVDAFARIMADVRTAAERCPDFYVAWTGTAVNAQKERLHISDADYFAFRKKAHDLASGMEDSRGEDLAVAPWCVNVFARYGSQGSAKAGLLYR